MKKILILSDNKPGHESVPYGIIEYLKKYSEIETLKLNVILRVGFLRYILKFLVNNKLFLNNLSPISMKFFYTFSEDIDFNNIDLIISSGGNTSFMNAVLSKHYEIPNVLCTYLRGLNNNLFTYILTISGNDTYDNSLFFDLLPVKVVKDNVEISEFKKNVLFNNKNVWSVLIGGKTKEYPFSDSEILLLTTNILEKAKQENTNILFTTSRRTGLKLEKSLSDLVKEYDNVIYSVFYNLKPEKIISKYLYNSDAVFVTEDSGSMITESIYAQKPTITVSPNEHDLEKRYKYSKYIKNLVDRNYIQRCTIDNIAQLKIEKKDFQFYDISSNEENFKKIYKLMEKKT